MITIKRDHLIYAMSKTHSPICRVPVATDICFETCDCFADQIQSVETGFTTLDWDRINPATGPVYVEGAEIGDVLKVTIKKITLVRDYAIMVTLPKLGVLGDQLTDSQVKFIPLKEGNALLPAGITVPIQPMIGVIGVAPAGEAISCGTPDAHGGNMDSNVIGEGATLWLPVNVAGALFALGDLHAAMGNGEVSGCGLEIAGEVVVSFEVIKGRHYPLPMVSNAHTLYTLSSAVTLDAAAEQATKNMAQLLVDYAGLSPSDAITIMSIAGDLQISQVVDPLKTSRFALPRNVLTQLGIVL